MSVLLTKSEFISGRNSTMFFNMTQTSALSSQRVNIKYDLYQLQYFTSKQHLYMDMFNKISFVSLKGVYVMDIKVFKKKKNAFQRFVMNLKTIEFEAVPQS